MTVSLPPALSVPLSFAFTVPADALSLQLSYFSKQTDHCQQECGLEDEIVWIEASWLPTQASRYALRSVTASGDTWSEAEAKQTQSLKDLSLRVCSELWPCQLHDWITLAWHRSLRDKVTIVCHTETIRFSRGTRGACRVNIERPSSCKHTIGYKGRQKSWGLSTFFMIKNYLTDFIMKLFSCTGQIWVYFQTSEKNIPKIDISVCDTLSICICRFHIFKLSQV